MPNPANEAPRLLGNQSWREHAACLSTPHRRVDPELFFPEPDEMERIREAKALCAQCPVRKTCLDAALENGDNIGIRGGMTEEEREPLHKKMEHRLDYSRVNDALVGHDIFLTRTERRAVTRNAYLAGLPAERLAWILKISEGHAQKLYRRTRREIRNRAVEKSDRAPASGASRTKDLKQPTSQSAARNGLGTAA